MRFAWSRSTLALLSAFAAACGGAVRSDLLSDDPGFGNLGDASAVDSGPAPVPSDAGGGGGIDATTSTDGGVVVADAGRFDAGRPDSGVVTLDAGRPDSGVVDAGATRLRCGPPANGLTCDRNAESCCAAGADTGRATYTCELSGDCGGNDVPIECATNADCGSGKVCCGYLQSSTWYSVECVSSCGSSGSYSAFTMCVPGVPGGCPSGRSCVASQRLVGYGYCN
jgi:hypothetical protein